MVDSHGRFVWYELVTTDVEAAMTFYTKVIGWGAWDASVPGKVHILFSDGKASVAGLTHLPDSVRETGVDPSWVGYVGVDDVDATADRIKRLGGTVHIPPMDVSDISRFSIFADPQTARLALFKWLKPDQERLTEPDARGHVGWHELIAADWAKALAFYGDLFGWRREDADIGDADEYQLFSAGGQTIGGMVTKPPTIPAPLWLYYFNVDDIDAAAQRVKSGGGQILDGPTEVPGGSWIIRCVDPQGALFALKGTRRSSPVGYFERAASRDTSSAPGRKWSW